MADDDGALFAHVVLTAAAWEACAAGLGGFQGWRCGAVPGGGNDGFEPVLEPVHALHRQALAEGLRQVLVQTHP